MTATSDFVERFDRLPIGAYGGTFNGSRYRIAKSQMANGRSQKLEAEELGGTDYISFNLYRLENGTALLKPCEMSETKVIDFVMRLDVD